MRLLICLSLKRKNYFRTQRSDVKLTYDPEFLFFRTVMRTIGRMNVISGGKYNDM